MVPTRLRGLSDAYGSWNTICISRRSGRRPRRERPVMSRPSKVTVPAVGSCRRTRQRPRVDLPQPDSPTRPTVSPGMTSKVTPSTACTWATSRWRMTPCVIGKCFLTSRAVSSGSVRGAHAELHQPRIDRGAPAASASRRSSRWHASRWPASAVGFSRAPRSGSGRSAGRQRGWKAQPAGSCTSDGGWPGMAVKPLRPRPVEPRDGAQQAPRVGVLAGR